MHQQENTTISQRPNVLKYYLQTKFFNKHNYACNNKINMKLSQIQYI